MVETDPSMTSIHPTNDEVRHPSNLLDEPSKIISDRHYVEPLKVCLDDDSSIEEEDDMFDDDAFYFGDEDFQALLSRVPWRVFKVAGPILNVPSDLATNW